MARRLPLAGALLASALVVALLAPPADAVAPSIAVDADAAQGLVRPTVAGQMMEWALPNMNEAWAERIDNRSFEEETVVARRSPLYDGFPGATLDRSRWSPTSLDAAPAGTVAVSGGEARITAATNGRFGLLSTDLPDTQHAGYAVETRLTGYDGLNAFVSLYGGAGAGDFSRYAEFGIEGGLLKVFADGQTPWVGGAATTPAVLRVEVTPPSGGARTLRFLYNGALVHTITAFPNLPDPFRVFLYGYSGTVRYDYVTAAVDDTYDAFGGPALSSRWAPARLEGTSDGSVALTGGRVRVTGAGASRYGILSAPIRNSAVDWTTLSARLVSQSGTNALMSVYGGSGAGDFSKFVEFGVEGGVAKVYTASGVGNFSGASVALPATLEVLVSPYYANGRRFKFLVNGRKVHEIVETRVVPPKDFRVFLYGYGSSVSEWDHLNVRQRHMWDPVAPQFEGGGLSVEWTPTTLAGGWGSAGQSDGRLTINGASNSRYGIISPPLDESDFYGYTVEAKLDSYTGTNGLLNLYAGSGRGDFSKYLEFGVEGGNLKVYGDGLPSWNGPAATTPAVLRIEVTPWSSSGRSFNFFYNDRLVHTIENVATIPDQDYHAFLYGWSTSVTTWDYLTWWRQPTWSQDGHSARAAHTHTTDAYNGAYAQRLDISRANGGRSAVSQREIAVTAGRQYQFTAYLKQSNLQSPVTVSLGPAVGDSPGYSAYASATISSVAGTWTKYTVTLTPTTTDQRAKLSIATAGPGALLVDMPSLMPTDPAEVVHGGWRRDFVDRLTALQPKVVRWPGGIIADWYDWGHGVGPRDTRPPQFFAQWDAQWMANDVGTHEILELGRQLGIEVVLNVNWGTGTASQAANWVEYVNGASTTAYGSRRAANGRSAPWGNRQWEIGNEVWGPWTPGWTSNAQAFADSYVQFRDAMHARDGGLVYFGEGGDGNTTDQSWNSTLLRTAGSRIDHLSTHYYPPQFLPQNYDSSAVYLASVGSPAVVGDRLAATQSTILDASDDDIKVAVTEYNAMYFNEEFRRTRTLEAGLQVAGHVNLFARNPQLTEVNFYSTLMNFWDGGGIRLGNRGSFVTPAHEALRMFANNHGPVLLRTQATGDTYNAPAMGNLPARSNVPYLDVTTTKSSDGRKIYISVVNRHPTQDLATPITVSNAGSVASTATLHRLHAGSYRTKNTWQAPTAVQAQTSTLTGVGTSFTHTFPAHSYSVIVLDANAPAVDPRGVLGQVTTATGSPISGATVQVVGVGTAVTNGAGYYHLPVPTAGRYEIRASASGYQPASLYRVDVTAGGATPLPIRLTP